VDYEKQVHANSADGRLRPDVVVKLPDGGQLIIDAKAPVDAFLRAFEAPNEEQRLAHLRDHVRLVKTHIAALSGKEYWGQFDRSPEFVVMFLPGEAFFSAALEQDPELIARSVEQRVILASPITLIAMLRAVAYGWRQKKIEEQVEEIARLGGDLYDRLGVLSDHFGKVGDSLGRATKSYNDAVGSLERNVLSAARKMKDLGAPGKREMLTLEPVEETVREVQAKELRGGKGD
jgi:DNA recombination protein RmuC